MENDLILWERRLRLFPNIKAKEETITAVENLFIFFVFLYFLVSVKYFNIFLALFSPLHFPKQHFCVRSNADLAHFRYWGVSGGWALPSEQVERTRSEAVCVLVCINGQIGMFFKTVLFHFL